MGMSCQLTFAMRAPLAEEALVDGVAKILIVDGPPLREKGGEITVWRLYVSPRTSRRLLTAVRSCSGPPRCDREGPDRDGGQKHHDSEPRLQHDPHTSSLLVAAAGNHNGVHVVDRRLPPT